MGDFFSRLLDGSDFVPRWTCGNWSGGHGWLHVSSDVAVFGAYMAIPVVLAYFIVSRRDVPFPRIFWMFGAFIGSCGVGHLVEAIIFWEPVYRLSGLMKLTTAVVSWATVVVLIRIMPQAMRLRSPTELEREVQERTAELQRRRAELDRINADLLHANTELKQFAYVVSHDLRAPLRAVRSFSELLADRVEGGLDATGRDYLRHVTAGVTRMDVLIRDLLAYARTERSDASAEDVDLRELAETVAAELAHSRPETPPTFVIGDLPVVRGEKTKLRQVLQNLLDNAVKFSGPRPAEVRVDAEATRTGWAISVSDDGIGLEPRFAERIFEPFQRLHLPEEYEGTGIGLSIVRKIVRQAGGDIRVQSQPGKGATFTFTLLRAPG